MRREYHLSYSFHDTLAEAEAEALERNRIASPYQRREHPAHAVPCPWISSDGREVKYLCCYYYKNW